MGISCSCRECQSRRPKYDPDRPDAVALTAVKFPPDREDSRRILQIVTEALQKVNAASYNTEKVKE